MPENNDLDFTDGTDQLSRAFRALDEGYFNVDELSFNELLVMSAMLAEKIPYFTEVLSKDAPAGAVQKGNWLPLFAENEVVALASILCADTVQMEREFFALDKAVKVIGMARYICAQAEKVDGWAKAFYTLESRAARIMRPRIEGLVKEKLAIELHTAGSLLARWYQEPRGVAGPEPDFSTYSGIWGCSDASGSTVFPLARRMGDKSSVDHRQSLRSSFRAFQNGILALKNPAASLLNDSLKSQNHPSAIGLFIAYLLLFQKAQKKLNSFTQRHLDFYYFDVLKAKPYGRIVDSTYLVFELMPTAKEILLKKGTEFIAGVDQDKKDVIYKADNDIVVGSAKVSSLRTLDFQQDPLVSPENAFGFVTAAKVNAIPAGDLKDSVDDRGSAAYPLFGAAHGTAEQACLNDADIGFAIASPVLYLQEGERLIRLTFKMASIAVDSQPDSGFYCFLKRYMAGLKESLYSNKPDTQSLRADVFFKAFRSFLTIHLTTENGWYHVDDYLPSSRIVDDTCPEDCFTIQIGLAPKVPPISAYSSDIHGPHYDTDLPLIRFVLNPESYVYSYSVFEKVRVARVDIDVDVKGIRDLTIHNQVGRLNANEPFNPFGSLPEVGAYFIVASREAVCKRITGFDVNLEWGGLPTDHDNFSSYYRSYGDAYGNDAFKISVSVLNEGRWLPGHENGQVSTRLFTTLTENAAPADRPGRIAAKSTLSCESVIKFARSEAVKIATDIFTYDNRARNGFFKFTLMSPTGGFGHKAYPFLLADALTAKARLEAVGFLQKIFRSVPALKPLPNSPYTPLVNSVTVNYQATARIDPERVGSSDEVHVPERFYQIHPFGFAPVRPSDSKGIRLVPDYGTGGNLFVGLSAESVAGVITLFFHLREDSLAEVTGEQTLFTWYYLSSNRWKKLNQEDVLADTTRGFLTSGIVTLNLADDISLNNSIMPGDRYWLRINAKPHEDRLCSLYGVYAQALKVNWSSDGGRLENAQKRLPAGSIKAPNISIPGIGIIKQIVDSSGGGPVESRENLKIRISERLKHKNRAVTPWDYERLILQRFPMIHKVKCFPNRIAGKGADAPIRAGHILIAVIPRLTEKPSENIRPMANRLLLHEIKSFIEGLGSPFGEINVRNPAYEQIQIRCTVKLKSDARSGFYIKALNQAVFDYLSPWEGPGYTTRFGWTIRQADLEAYIHGLDYVDFVTDFSMLRIVKDEVTQEQRGPYRLFDTAASKLERQPEREFNPLLPWSIAIPVKHHFIKTTDRIDSIVARPAGIDELEIGSNFILTEK